MKKNKINIGQCYEDDDHIYMIMYETKAKDWWNIQDTLSKEEFIIETEDLLKLRKPFNNCG